MRPSLVCLPYAGAGASIFWDWKSRLGGSLQVVAPQLPGREQRFREALVDSVDACVADLLPKVVRNLTGNTPVSLFGHCLGAVLAYELTRALLAIGVGIRRLFVSGARGPSAACRARAAGLSDAQFLARVGELAGYRHPALDDPSLRGALLPILRADITMHESYLEGAHRPIDAAITAIRGADDLLVSDDDLEGWRHATTGEFHLARVSGGHMYFAADPREVIELIVRDCGA